MIQDKSDKSVNQEQGFTMLEIVTVLVLLGIISAVAVPKYFDMQGEAEKKAAKAALAEAQVRINAGYSKAVYAGKSCEDAVAKVNKIESIAEKVGDSYVIGQFEFTENFTISSATGTEVQIRPIGGTKEYSGTLTVPSCETESGSSGSGDLGLECPKSEGTTEKIITCDAVKVSCNGTVICSCSESGTMVCSCNGTDIGKRDDNIQPGVDHLNTVILPFNWEFSEYYRNGVGFDKGNVLIDDGKYYVLAWNNYFSSNECKEESISNFKDKIAYDATDIWKGKWLIPMDISDEKWAVYENVGGRYQWLKIKDGQWVTSGGVLYGDLCYFNGKVYIFSSKTGTDAPGVGTWIQLTTLNINTND